MGNFLNTLGVLIIIYACHTPILAQNNAVFNHFYANPYILNPAEAGSDAFTSLKLNHRQQWRGLEGAPVITNLTFQTPFDYKKFALALNATNFTRGIITTTDVLATYAYTVYLTKETTFHFGLSVGVTGNSLDLSEVGDLNDSVLSDFQNDNIQPIGNFGIKLKSPSGFNLGVSLPRLFEPNLIAQQDFQSYDFSPVDEVVVMTYFKRKLDKKIVTRRKGGVNRRVAIEDAYAPLQLYVLYKYSKIVDQRIEVVGTLNLGENLMLGAAYRLNHGFAGLLGINAGSFSFNYAYDPSANQIEGFTQGTHEIQISLNIGEKKKLQRSKPILRTMEKKETHQARFSHENIQTGGSEEESAKGKKFYVVLNEFRDFNSADQFVSRVKKENDLNTDIFYNKNNKRFYVYIFETGSSREATKEKKAVEDLTKFKNVKIIIIDQ